MQLLDLAEGRVYGPAMGRRGETPLMKGEPEVLEALNGALKIELTAVNQFVLHARMMEHWGFLRRGQKEMKEAIEEMKHADLLIKRILLLEGEPRLDSIGKLVIGRDLRSAIEGDLTLEREAMAFYREVIGICERASDFVSRDLMVGLLADEEEHEHHLQTELELIDQIGIERYAQSMLGDWPEEGEG